LKFFDSEIHCFLRPFPHEHQTADGSFEPPFYLRGIFPDFSLGSDEALKRHGKEIDPRESPGRRALPFAQTRARLDLRSLPELRRFLPLSLSCLCPRPWKSG